jgi:hypothetical protein
MPPKMRMTKKVKRRSTHPLPIFFLLLTKPKEGDGAPPIHAFLLLTKPKEGDGGIPLFSLL